MSPVNVSFFMVFFHHSATEIGCFGHLCLFWQIFANCLSLFCLIFGFLSYFNLWLFKSYFVILRFILGEGYPFSPFVIYNKVFQKCESLDFLSIINLR